jgi:hypothetical protein
MKPANPENVPLDKIPAGWRLLYANEYENDKVLCRVWDDGRFTEVQRRANYPDYTYITPDRPDNGQPWHAHKPGDPAPVEDAVNVDIVCRNGLVFSSQLSPEWRATTRGELDILFYRLHEPAPMKAESPTFEAHGHTWFRHTPGDPCPVNEGKYLFILCQDQECFSPTKRIIANCVKWSHCTSVGFNVIGWRYADQPSAKPTTPTSDRILSILIAAGHITEEQVEQARKLVKP